MVVADLTDVHSLAEFQRNAKKHISQIKKSRRPIVLTVNGRAEVVVQDAKSYQELLDTIDQLEAVAAIEKGLEESKQGKGVPARELLEKMRKKYKLQAK
jgi:PHD/YefM family antitoxin component YafN of YafNO toxin-antitoxin module